MMKETQYLKWDINSYLLYLCKTMIYEDLQILPSIYEAAIIRNKDIFDIMVEVSFVDRYTRFTSKENIFLDKKTGKDGLAYILATNKSIENLTLRGQYIDALTDTNARQSYIYSDASEALRFDGNGGREERDDFRIIYYMTF